MWVAAFAHAAFRVTAHEVFKPFFAGKSKVRSLGGVLHLIAARRLQFFKLVMARMNGVFIPIGACKMETIPKEQPWKEWLDVCRSHPFIDHEEISLNIGGNTGSQWFLI